jgi:hypothetical protein
MNSIHIPQRNHSFATLRRFIQERAVALETCELCSAKLGHGHQHLVEPSSRKLVCACDACTILFSSQEGKYRRVPKRIRYLPDFHLTDAQWENLLIPINMAFFFHSTTAGRVVACYPSPAGPTESLLTLGSWEELVEQNRFLKTLEPDVEALLVNRVNRGHRQAEYYLAPIDECYKLTGLIRARWHGLSGGTEVWEEIEHFFDQLKERSSIIREANGA